jgi:hypothetical protein
MKKVSVFLVCCLLLSALLGSCNDVSLGGAPAAKDVIESGRLNSTAFVIEDAQVYRNPHSLPVSEQRPGELVPYTGNDTVALYVVIEASVGGTDDGIEFDKYADVGEIRNGKLFVQFPAEIPDSRLFEVKPDAWMELTPSSGFKWFIAEFVKISAPDYQFIYANTDGEIRRYRESSSGMVVENTVLPFRKGWNVILNNSDNVTDTVNLSELGWHEVNPNVLMD